MSVMIQDRFTRLKVSRQRKWQLRRLAEHKCLLCGGDACCPTSSFCLKHAVAKREYQHVKDGCKRRNNCLTRRIQKQLDDAK